MYGTPGPYEDAVQNTPIFEENGPENFKGVDIMRAVRSFDPCLPCGVHMYTGRWQGAQGDAHADGAGMSAMDATWRAAASETAPEALLERVQELQEQLEPAARSVPRSWRRSSCRAIVQMYGVGLERILGCAAATAGEAASGSRLARRGPLVATLLLIHDLHPVPLEERVQAALDSVRPYMESHGGNVELLSLENGVARIHLRGSCSDCSASSVTLELAIKQALEEAAPDLDGLEVEGVAAQTTPARAADGHRPGAPTGMGSRWSSPHRPRRPRGSRSRWRRSRDGRLVAVESRRERPAGRQRRRDAARLPRTVRRLRRRRCTTAICAPGARVRPLRALFLPAAGRALDGRRAASSSSRCRCCASAGSVKVALAA